MNEFTNKAMNFEKVVGKILSKLCKINTVKISCDANYDFVTDNGIKIIVKYLRNAKHNIFLKYIRDFVAHRGTTEFDNVIFVSNFIHDDIPVDIGDKTLKKETEKTNTILWLDGIITNFITINNLLFLCEDDEALKIELLNCIDFSTENVTPFPLGKNVARLLNANYSYDKNDIFYTGHKLEESLLSIKYGKKDATKYEKFCFDFIEKIFSNNIENIESQKTNNHGLYRFDIIASIKKDPASFWKFIYDKFDSCFILFECKNYIDKITQEEIYSTARYLYKNAFRNVAIIFSRKGMTRNAELACKGLLRGDKQMILVLDDQDIIEINKLYYNNKFNNNSISPSDYLLYKAKEMLLNLEK